MIVFEEKIRELVALLPAHVDGSGTYPIRYDWGTVDVLNKFLVLPENVSKYPLIWLTNGRDTDDTVWNTVTRNARLVIATRSTSVDKFNEFQVKNDYNNILIPVYQNFITVLEKSGICVIIDQKVDKELSPNYSVNDNGNGLITTWNALVIDLEIRIEGNKCINNNIKF